MTPESLIAFAGAIFLLFFTPGPGVAAIVARTLDAGPRHGALIGAGIFSGDVILLTIAVTGLSAAAGQLGPLTLIFRIAGAAYLLWMAGQSLWKAVKPARRPLVFASGKAGLAGSYAAGLAMPFSNPKPIAFYLAFVPAFFDISDLRPAGYAAMVGVMSALATLHLLVHVGLAHKARGWMSAPKVRRAMDAMTGLIFLAVAALLLIG